MYSSAALLLDETRAGGGARSAEDGDAFTVRVAGNALEALDVRDGDRVVVVKGRVPEFGDLAALCVAGGARTLWKVYPEGDDSTGGRLHLSNGRGRWTVPAKNVEAIGVVVAVLRKFGG